MSKQIAITYEDKKYTLEYSRISVATMEKQGFRLGEVQDKMATMIPLMFSGAFIMHHPNEKQATVDKIFNNIDDKQKLVGALSDMIIDCYNSLFLEDNNTKEDEKKASWEIVD